ncbi:MAG TPA: hypothetical protein PLL33_04550, partial [Paracoccus sp. (in: a-proteobacteria)]|nr:hypothetical protein [Paracoccus sp. (in: a-proteobacteria)]
LRLTVPQGGKLALLARVAEARALIEDVDIVPPSLEDIYSRISRRDAAPQAGGPRHRLPEAAE